MEDVTRKRIMRALERLPEEQLYQVLDYMEFLAAKYARDAARRPDPFQQFAERVEDQMRLRSVAPAAMKGTMRVMSTAGRFLDGVRELGRDLGAPLEPDRREATPRGPQPAGEDGRASGEDRPGTVSRSRPGSPGDETNGTHSDRKGEE